MLEALAQAKEAESRAPMPADPEMDQLLRDIEARSPQAVLTHPTLPAPCIRGRLRRSRKSLATVRPTL